MKLCGQKADDRQRLVIETAEANPRATQRELGALLGMSRDMVGYYLNRQNKRQVRRVLFPLKRGPKARARKLLLDKKHWRVGVRAAAVRAAHAAFPYLGMSELAAALGMHRSMVRHYIISSVKSGDTRLPGWGGAFFEACRALAAGQNTDAAYALVQVSQMITAPKT